MADIRKTQWSDLGAGHTMESDITLRSTGRLEGKTRTRTATMLGGFTGGVVVL
jgi:hypothetical protein